MTPFAQEFLCVFLKASGAWLPLELIAGRGRRRCTTDWPSWISSQAGTLFGGIDVARDRDATVMWLDEQIGDVSWTRMVLRLHGMPVTEQHDILAPFVQLTTRTADRRYRHGRRALRHAGQQQSRPGDGHQLRRHQRAACSFQDGHGDPHQEEIRDARRAAFRATTTFARS
jgi:hypothetical protein